MSREPKFGTGLTRGSTATARGHPAFFAEQHVADTLNAMNPGNCVDFLLGTDPVATLPYCDIITGTPLAPNETLATAAAKYRPYAHPVDAHNAAPATWLLTPLQRYSAFAQVRHRVLDTWLLHGQLVYADLTTASRLAETPLQFGDRIPTWSDIYLDRTNIYNFFAQDIGRHAGQGEPNDTGEGIGSGTVYRRLVELGPRLLNRENRTVFARMGLDGNSELLALPYTFDIAVSYGRNRRVTEWLGDVNMEHVKLALGPAVECNAAPGCVPLNLLGEPGTATAITPAMLDYIEAGPLARQADASALDVTANVVTELFDRAAWPPGGIGVAFGAQHRAEDFSETLDAALVAGTTSRGGVYEPTAGRYRADEAYGEIRVPLLRELPFARALEISLAGRYTDYAGFAPRLTGKTGLRYKPIDNLLLRATWAQAYRAPSLSELYQGRIEGMPVHVLDPCSRSLFQDTEEPCQQEGVPARNVSLAQEYDVAPIYGGNPALQPEHAENWTAGLVYSPAFAPAFDVYVDYFDIALDNFIQFPDPYLILNTCYRRPVGAPRPETCDFVQRSAAGLITAIDLRPFNYARARTNGIDVTLGYDLPLRDWLPESVLFPGALRWELTSTYVERLDFYTPSTDSAGDIRLPAAGRSFGDQVYPRFRANASLSWSNMQWGASWTTRYLRGTVEACSDGLQPSLSALGLCSNPDPNPNPLSDFDASTNRLADVYYHDLQVSYAFALWNMRVGAGVWNLFNQDPPVSYQALANSYAGGVYRPPESRAP